ncbi:hypothetical protein [Nocardioides mangrovi]|uniref:P27 family phage terminase small subunit n=1 Tax=Nocardioides mangrovi TaxID=2874580 RepID=A0ABS7U9I9_9ACTN|nr:hypothetical protein [Nocardioides mangrovi]MBZ5737510.1 hypothetical protein [Nocardioides mangrovi]
MTDDETFNDEDQAKALDLVAEAGLTPAIAEGEALVIPAGLTADAQALYADIANRYTLRPDEWSVLEAACRSLSLAEELTLAYARDPEPMVRASHGGMQVNPLLIEAERARDRMAKHLRQLRLPDESGLSPFSHAARGQKGGQTRWSREAERVGKYQRAADGPND